MEHNLIILTKDKSLDTWLFTLLTMLKKLVNENNKKSLLENSFMKPKVKLISSLESDDFELFIIYFYQGVQKRLYIDVDLEDSLSNKYGYEGLVLSLKEGSKTPNELCFLLEELDKDYTVFLEETEFYELVN